MKKLFLGRTARYLGIFMILMAFSLSLTSCVVHTPSSHRTTHKRIPPGQHKKLHGDKSAKRYTPKKQKKHYKKTGKPNHMKKNNHKRGR
ncbi:hypothetical protein [Paenimyroides viscosum]|jgi:hypothetical protein|uniref:Quinol oxidase subunit 4 n=1 Tax=Paenimyroides viscosum TaxID=2488729 RepID=A0A3P1B1Z5_9FLAO|nr:hypothetical protein [Paenimyroides viscosum]RRA94672.1 hypothetical protein EG242_08320 [Paenimyroides viscosum]